ncbi:Uroporphyrinogen decarboxylase [Hondaea fermentalgiana]|uniref:Uroporphyrinogen decarboxylase n=1 Tax=Hondaea fermentalgiana TaxID=2315210 RepID=A0A2R5GQM3_9STRA|nr:Uroporphyrinogen decarboxylase [Hondaea fermentalgiana]|eukprot:GBG32058.1 Uroporphyrinogen decarboxylase [Hondaea fermentalgiana]
MAPSSDAGQTSWASLTLAVGVGAVLGAAAAVAAAKTSGVEISEFGKAPKGAATAGRLKPDESGAMAAGRRKVKRVPVEDFPPAKNDLLLRAARGEETERVPVWMHRQAGRYLPEFRELRKHADFFTMCQDPELATEVTLQPLERFPTLDAVIVFSDILVIPQAMGMEVQMVPGRGPVFPDRLVDPADLDRLNFKPDMEKTLGYVYDVVNLTRQRVKARVPVIGFSGAPFTLMGYMIEGGGSKTMSKVKAWLYCHPEASKKLLQALTDIIIEYLVGKVRAGAQLLEVFESSGGDLGPELYDEFSHPYLCQIATKVKAELRAQGLPEVPMTVFARNVRHEGALEKLADSEYDTLSLDWNILPEVARRRVSIKKASLQGNLDPCALYASPDRIRALVQDMVKGFGTQRYIANLGHGMLPDHDPEHAHALILAVQEVSAEMNKKTSQAN